MSPTAPVAPGGLGVAIKANDALEYLGRLDAWLGERRAELGALDERIIATSRQAELTPDLALALALWQAAKTRQGLLLEAWDSGRVGPQELDRLNGLIWGRLDTASSQLSQLQSMAVSLPEAGRLCDALVAQLRSRLNTDPKAEQQQIRLRDLRAQFERIRDQVKLEPAALAPRPQALLEGLVARAAELGQKRERGGDIGGLLGSLEVAAAKLERDLIVGSAQRRQASDLLTRARQSLAQIRTAESLLRERAERLATQVWPTSVELPPAAATLGALPNTAAGLSGYLERLGQLEGALVRADQALDRAAAEKDSVSSLLPALQAKAASQGHAADPALRTIGSGIESLLQTAPLVLPVVQQLLAAYSAQLDYLNRSGR